jgi:hypothetical protein
MTATVPLRRTVAGGQSLTYDKKTDEVAGVHASDAPRSSPPPGVLSGLCGPRISVKEIDDNGVDSDTVVSDGV